MNTPTDWVSAIAILAAGLVLGSLFIFFFNRRKAGQTLGGEPDLALKDLQAKRDALVQQLRDPALAPGERTRLELETADVLRRLDAYEPAPTSATATQTAAPQNAMNPTIKGFLWGAGSFAALAALGFFVMQQASPREEGGVITGGMESQQRQQGAAQPDPVILQMEAAVQRDPNNLQLRDDLAQAYLERDNLMGVFEQTKYVLDRAPNDSRALTFQGLVRLAMGEGPAALQMLQRATQADPKNLDSWVALAWVHAQSGDMQKAEAMIAEAAKNSPGDKPRLDQVFAQMKQHVAQASAAPPAQTASAGELPPGHPTVDGGGVVAASAAPQPAGPSVQVTLDLDPSAKSRSGVLFVIARNPAGGPPAAVKRVMAASFPITVALSSADSMMGQQLPEKFRLEARLDSDGDPLTKLPTDPIAMQNDVAPGATVKLALK